MRLIGIICVSLLVVALAIPAYAETQNVKVSGDITVRGIYRDQFDLNKNDNEADSDNFIMSTVELQVDADLTDNVSTCIRLVNQRNWGNNYPTQVYSAPGGFPFHDVLTWKDRLVEVGVDLAYVKIKEMIFEPVTLTIGRQDLWFGRGFIIGANQIDPGFIPSTLIQAQPFNRATQTDLHAIGSPELTAYNSFDAVRTTIDFEKYAPFVVDLVYAKIEEGLVGPEEDVDLYGVNAGYTFDVYNAEAEAYYWFKYDDSIPNINIREAHEVHVIGTRGSFQPVSEWVFGGEVAYQFGHYTGTLPASVGPGIRPATYPVNTNLVIPDMDVPERDRSAWALDLYADYLGWMDYAWSPKVGAEYIFLSGDTADANHMTETWKGWDCMFCGYYPMAIRPWLGTYYMTDLHPLGEDSGLTNQHQIILSGSVQPLDDLSFEAKVAGYWFDEQPDSRFYGKANKEFGAIGQEINLTTTYDYTEDVTFSLLSAWFFPGRHYEPEKPFNTQTEGVPDINMQIASEIVGTMKVSF